MKKIEQGLHVSADRVVAPADNPQGQKWEDENHLPILDPDQQQHGEQDDEHGGDAKGDQRGVKIKQPHNPRHRFDVAAIYNDESG